MEFFHTLQAYVVRYWQMAVILLMLSSLSGDVLARKRFPRQAILAGTLNAGGWAVLLGTQAPFARSISFNCIISYIATVLIALFFFGEKITRSQFIGIILGGVAIVLLV